MPPAAPITAPPKLPPADPNGYVYNVPVVRNGQTTYQSGKASDVAKDITTIYSGNVQEKHLPDLTQRMTAITNKGQFTDAEGGLRYADGSIVQERQEPEAGSPESDVTEMGIPKNEQALLDSMRASTDEATKASIDLIESTYHSLIDEQKQINAGQEASVGTALLRAGSARYSPESAAGQTAAQASYGLKQIANLEAKEQAAIAGAKAAQQQKNYEVMGKQLELAEGVRKEKQAAAQKVSETLATKLEAQQKAAQQASRDSAISSLIAQGVSDPNQLLDYLNFDEKGNMVGDFSAKEVSDTLKNLTVSGDESKLPQDIQNFNYLKKNGMLPEAITTLPDSQQYLGYINLQKLAESGKLTGSALTSLGGGSGNSKLTIGKGASNETEEQIIRMRLFSKLSNVLNKGALSDSDREIINDNIVSMRAAGLSEQDIMSQLAGFPSDVKTPYNSSFIDTIAASTDTMDKQQQLMAKTGQLLASGNYDVAMNTVENAAMATAKKADPDAYMGTATAKTYVDKIERIKKLINENIKAPAELTSQNVPGLLQMVSGGSGVGPLTGSFQNILGRFKGQNATQIKAELTSLYADFRHENLGSAVTPSESTFLEPLMASITDKSGNFMEKLDVFERNLLSQYNNTRQSASLPTVSTTELTDPAARLKLYASQDFGTNPFASSLGNGGGDSFYSLEEGYRIPE